MNNFVIYFLSDRTWHHTHGDCKLMWPFTYLYKIDDISPVTGYHFTEVHSNITNKINCFINQNLELMKHQVKVDR